MVQKIGGFLIYGQYSTCERKVEDKQESKQEFKQEVKAVTEFKFVYDPSRHRSARPNLASISSDMLLQIMSFLSAPEICVSLLINHELGFMVYDNDIFWAKRLKQDFYFQAPCVPSVLYDAKEAAYVNTMLRETKEAKKSMEDYAGTLYTKGYARNIYIREMRHANYLFSHYWINNYLVLRRYESYLRDFSSFARRYALSRNLSCSLMPISVENFEMRFRNYGFEAVNIILSNHSLWLKSMNEANFKLLYKRYFPEKYTYLRRKIIEPALNNFSVFGKKTFVEFLQWLKPEDQTYVIEYLIGHPILLSKLPNSKTALKESLCYQLFDHMNKPFASVESKQEAAPAAATVEQLTLAEEDALMTVLVAEGMTFAPVTVPATASEATAEIKEDSRQKREEEFNKQKELVLQELKNIQQNGSSLFLSYLIVNWDQLAYVCQLFPMYQLDILKALSQNAFWQKRFDFTAAPTNKMTIENLDGDMIFGLWLVDKRHYHEQKVAFYIEYFKAYFTVYASSEKLQLKFQQVYRQMAGNPQFLLRLKRSCEISQQEKIYYFVLYNILCGWSSKLITNLDNLLLFISKEIRDKDINYFNVLDLVFGRRCMDLSLTKSFQAILWDPGYHDSFILQGCIKNFNDLKKLYQHFSTCVEFLFEEVLGSKAILLRVISSFDDLKALSELFPAHKQRLLECVFANNEIVKQITAVPLSVMQAFFPDLTACQKALFLTSAGRHAFFARLSMSSTPEVKKEGETTYKTMSL